MNETAAAAETGAGPVRARLFIEVLGPPIIWAVRLSASYLIVPYACWEWGIWSLHLVTLVTLAATLAIGVLSFRDLKGARSAPELVGEADRTRFMAYVGVLSSGIFSLAIIAEGLANVFIDPCIMPGTPVP